MKIRVTKDTSIAGRDVKQGTVVDTDLQVAVDLCNGDVAVAVDPALMKREYHAFLGRQRAQHERLYGSWDRPLRR